MPFFFFNDTATTEIYTLSLHDALPIYGAGEEWNARPQMLVGKSGPDRPRDAGDATQRLLDSRSEEHTSELQSQSNLVCRLLLEKKKIDRAYRLHDYRARSFRRVCLSPD